MLARLFEQFLKERRYLKNSSELTIKFYRQSFNRYSKAIQNALGKNKDDEIPTKEHLNSFVIGMRETGISPISCNISIRGMNAFLTWLYENQHTSEHLRIKQLKEEKKVAKTFNENQLKRIINWKPKGFYQWRLYALLCLLMDTGLRVEEALTLKSNRVDFDNMLITVMGKGSKERIVPMSLELRKLLYNWKKQHNFDYFFPTRSGGRLSYHNILKELKHLCDELSIDDVKISFHQLRRAFAKGHIQNGGSVFHLMRMLGHSNVTTTQRYINLLTDDLKETHAKTSILNRLK